MSIFFDFEVGSSGRRFRRAVDGDKYDIQLILDSSHTQLFGCVDIGKLIELSTLSICMINANKEVTGLMCLCDHPNVPALDPADWELWIRNMFQKYYLSRNTLFIHFLCCIKDVEEIFMEEALVSVFQNDVYLLHIILMVPPQCPEDCYLKYQTFRKRNFYKCCAQRKDDTECGYFYYVALRREFCPQLKIRRAVEEDNDDIVEILDKKCPELKDLYGDFYISEIVGRHPEMQRKIIVADYQDVAVGVMCLNTEVNYDMLQKTYELEPFYGLKKATVLAKEQIKRNNMLLRTFGEPIMLGAWSPFQRKSNMAAAQIEDEPSKENLVIKSPKSLSKVNFGRNAAMRRSLGEFFLRQQSSEEMFTDKINANLLTASTSLRKSKHSVVDLLDEDPFDYDIVNIDTSLLAVPDVLSCDFLSFAEKQGPKQSRMSQMFTSIKRRISNFSRPAPTVPVTKKYLGEPNAFIIELYGFREDIDERHGFDLLEAAFEIYKEFDYCIIQVPCTEKSFPLLQHFCFVPYKANVSSKYALYVAHKNSVLSKLRVRRAEFIDVPQIAQLMQSVDGKETIWTVEDTIMRKSELNVYVFMSGVSLVGVGILEPPDNISYIRAKFNIDSNHIHKYHGADKRAGISTLKAVLVYPAFEPHYRFFMREMMRLSDITSLMWLTAYRNKWVIHKANSVAPAMVPLLPRKFEIDYGSVQELSDINKLSKTFVAFSVWYMSKKITSIPRVNIDTRIVVIGASRTTRAFLNSLIFSDATSYLFFTNVTLISKNGLSYVRRQRTVADMMFLKCRCSSEDYLKSVPYTYYVNVIQGTMVEINKKEKYVKLANASKCHYDLLFLLFGKQYQHPAYLRSALLREKAIKEGSFVYKPLDVPQHCEEHVISNYTPENVFIITNASEANRAVNYVKNLIYGGGKIIVYGASIHVYCCLAALLELKVPGENIIFVEPFPPLSPSKPRMSLFCNDYVDNKLKDMFKSLKIETYRSFYFQSWYVDTYYPDIATHVEFLSYFKLLRLECAAFFYYGKRSIDEQAFVAINKSGMAYDGGVLIDHEFRTKDPAIYAAGPATIYNRQYYAADKRQKYYDSYEVGSKLGSQIRNQLDPLFTEVKESRKQSVRFSATENNLDSASAYIKDFSNQDVEGTSSRKMSSLSRESETELKLPEFKKPRITHCILPGGLQYLEVRPPGLQVPHHYMQSLHYSGFVMETFKNGYFKIHLTNELIVDGITCLTPEKYQLENFKNLYGQSAVVLNNVHLRYATRKLDNFYEFFRSPWAVFLYHDQIDELFAMAKELLPKGQHHGDTLKEGLRNVARKLYRADSFNTTTKLQIRSNFEKSPHIEAITDYVIEWLSENDVLLPMYFQPWLTGHYTHDVSRNPAFRKRKRSLINLLTAIY